MSKTRWYKAATDSRKAKSMLANDGDGVDEVLTNDGWSKDKPEGYVEPELERTSGEMLSQAMDEIERLQAKVADLESQLASKKGGRTKG